MIKKQIHNDEFDSTIIKADNSHQSYLNTEIESINLPREKSL